MPAVGARATAPCSLLVVAALLFLSPALPACGVAYPAFVAIALGGGGGGGGGGEEPVTASVSVTPVARQRSDVPVEYDLASFDGAAKDLSFEFALPGGAFQPASESPRPAGDGSGRTSDGTSALAAGPHVFVWDSALDLGGTFAVEGVVFRVTPRGGVAEITAGFTVGNDPPVFAAAALALEQEGLVLVEGTLTDSTGDVVDLEVEVVDRRDPATIVLGATAQLAAGRPEDGGLAVSLGWSSLADVQENALVVFRVTASDGLDAAPPVDLDVLVQNNDAPSVFLFPIARQVGVPATLAVEARIFDRFADDVDLDLRFTAANGAASRTGAVTLAAGASATRLRSSLQGVPTTLTWAIGEDLAGFPTTDPITEVVFEATPSDRDGTGVTKRARFQIGGAAPAAAFAPIAGTQAGLVPLSITLTGTGDPADLALTFRRLPSGVAEPLTVAFGDATALATAPGGVVHAIAWNTLVDVGLAGGAVEVSAVPTTTVGGQTFTGPAATVTVDIANVGVVTALVTEPAAGAIASARGGIRVPIAFLLFDAQPSLCSAAVAIDVGDGRGFHAPPGGALAGLAATPEGTRHVFLYDPAADGVGAAQGDRPAVRARVTPAGPGGAGAAALGPTFALDVNDPPRLTTTAIAGQAASGALVLSGSVVLETLVRDAEGDAVTIEISISRDQGLTFQPATTAPTPVTKPAGPTDAATAFALDTSALGPDGPEAVVLRLVPRDRASPSDPLGLGAPSLLAFTANNDENPQPLVAPLPPGGTLSGVVSVPFTLTDLLARPCDVAVEVSIDGLGGPFVPVAGGVGSLDGLSSAPTGAPQLFVWDTRVDLGTQTVPDVALRFRATTEAGALPARTGPEAVARLDIDNALEADVVLGQPDLEIGAVDGQGLYEPGRLHVGGGRLWICDRLNHRVLQFGAVPGFSGQGADLALGRTSAAAVAPSDATLSLAEVFLPFAVTFDVPTQRLFVSDAGQRVLVWSGVPVANGEPADAHLDIPGTPTGLSALGDDLYVANAAFDVVQRFRIGSALASLPASRVTAPAPDLVLSAPIAARDVRVFDDGEGLFRLVVSDAGPTTGQGALLIWTSRPTADVPPDLTVTAADFTGLGGPSGLAAFDPDALHVTSSGGLFVFDLAGAGLGGNASVLGLSSIDAAGAATAFRITETDLGPGVPFALGQPFSTGLSGDDTRLVAADPGAHRVLIFGPPHPPGVVQAATFVGQLSALGRKAHHNEARSFTLDRPSGIAADADRLIVCDTRGARVLVWEPLPDVDQLDAALVLGQADFQTTLPDGADPGLASMGGPRGAATDGTRLLVSDTTPAGAGLGRILVWLDVTSLANGAPADTALTGLDAMGIAWKPGPGPGAVGVLAAAVPALHAVLVWRDLDLAALVPGSPPAPTFVLGQRDTGGGVPAAIPNDPLVADPRARMFAPRGVWFDPDGETLFVSDAGNGRILAFDVIGLASTAPAALVLGQPDSATPDPGPGPRRSAPSANRVAGLPAGGAVDALGRLFVVDAAAHRVLLWNAVPSVDGASANGAFGQTRSTGAVPNEGGVRARSLYTLNGAEGAGFGPLDGSAPGVATSPDGAGGTLVWIADANNNRVLRVPVPPP